MLNLRSKNLFQWRSLRGWDAHGGQIGDMRLVSKDNAAASRTVVDHDVMGAAKNNVAASL